MFPGMKCFLMVRPLGGVTRWLEKKMEGHMRIDSLMMASSRGSGF